ncbi:type II secretion system protein N [Marinobacter caseinilyticus]|uniref:type II secretion system protein N n=1 Tax=Marinobacter caseinilyticus TaxID=2692195 RepID=UPI00140A9C67|nr:type II secretion system protein N [Marinobacter caseinilyticus]
MTESPTSPFLRPAKVVWLTLAGLLVYLVALVILLPAGWLWHWIEPHAGLPDQVRIHQVSGRVWEGEAGIYFNNRPLRVGWRLGMPDVSKLGLPLSFSVESAYSQVEGRLDVSWPGSAKVSAGGLIKVREFEDLIRRSGGAMLEGDVAIERLVLEWRDGAFGDGRGVARWSGGEVTWPMGDGVQSAQFPPMEAVLNAAAGQVSLKVSEQGKDEPVALADIFPDGMLEIQVFKRMVDLAGQSWSGAAQPGDTIFRVRQPLLPGGRQ